MLRNAEKLFLETTIQVERIFGSKKEEILEFLTAKETLTSNYVLMEFKRTMLEDCVALYTYLKEETGLEGTFHRLSEIMPYHHRTSQRINLILSKLCEDNSLEYEKVLNKLEDLIESELLEEFFYNVKLIDEIKCGFAHDEVRKNETYDFKINCNRKDKKRCELENFVTKNQDKFKKLLNDLKTIPEFKRLCEVIEEILKDCTKARGQENCWKLSDCIISIEAPKNFKIFTTDHHYVPICKSLKKDVLKV